VIPSSGVPTGTVNFMDGSNLLGNVTLSRYGTATLKVTSLAVGTHSITAVYSGDANFVTSTSAALPQVVQKAKTSMGLTSSDSSSVHGQSVTFTATIKSAAGIPSGTVQFMDNDTNLGGPVDLSSGTAAYTTSDLSVGRHAITAVYSGDDNFTSSSKTRWQIVRGAADPTANKATSLSLVLSPNPSTFGKSVTLRATVKSSVVPSTGIPTGTVNFMDGSNLLGSVTLSRYGTATFSISTLGAGTHSITAVYVGDANFLPSTSAALTQAVQKRQPSTALRLSAHTPVHGQSVTFTATITSRAGVPSGTVQFMDNGTNLGGPVPLDPSGTATYTTSDLILCSVQHGTNPWPVC